MKGFIQGNMTILEAEFSQSYKRDQIPTVFYIPVSGHRNISKKNTLHSILNGKK